MRDEGHAYQIPIVRPLGKIRTSSVVDQTPSLSLYLEAMSTVGRHFDASTVPNNEEWLKRRRYSRPMAQRRPGSGRGKEGRRGIGLRSLGTRVALRIARSVYGDAKCPDGVIVCSSGGMGFVKEDSWRGSSSTVAARERGLKMGGVVVVGRRGRIGSGLAGLTGLYEWRRWVQTVRTMECASTGSLRLLCRHPQVLNG